MPFGIPQSKIEYNFLEIYRNNITYLVKELSNIFKTDIDLELIQLKKSYHNSNILAQQLNLRSYKYRFVKLVSKLFKRLHIQKLDYTNNLNKTEGNSGLSLFSSPSYLSGINIKLAGRTFRQRVVPRMTVKRIQKGSLTNVNVQFIDKARFTSKTRRGAYSFTVTLGHVFK